MELEIEGDKLHISGVLSTGFDSVFWAMIYAGAETAHIKILPGESFSAQLSLRTITEPVPLKIFTSGTEYGVYRSLILQSIYIEPVNGGYRFCESAVLENNIEKSKGWINPPEFLGGDIPAEIKTLSDEIVKDAKSDYEKVFLLYQWMTRNICYDYDAVRGLSARIVAPSEVLALRRSVCEGYANLLQALVQAQNIPCIIVQALCLDADAGGWWTEEYISASEVNHVYNEAFVDGRWIVMDSTWDSLNKYENGKYYYEDPNCYIYFDSSLQFFSGDHRIVFRPEASVEDTPSMWAAEEISAAVRCGFVPAELQGSYREGITREEFCVLLMDMLCRKSGMSLEEFLKSKDINPDIDAFTDTSGRHVLAAAAAGIVSGRGNNLFDPKSLLTRQEAAKILACAARLMGKLPDGHFVQMFSDSDQFEPWASPHIEYLAALQAGSGRPIMNGIENNRFSPLSVYTREQAIVTVYRLYECL